MPWALLLRPYGASASQAWKIIAAEGKLLAKSTASGAQRPDDMHKVESNQFLQWAAGVLHCAASLLSLAIFLLPLAGAPGLSACGLENTTGADLSTPGKTCETYLRAIKANDLTAAKACFLIADDTTFKAIDSFVGQWIARRKLSAAVTSRFSLAEAAKTRERGLLDLQCTNDAIDRTLQRLTDPCVVCAGGMATLRIAWRNGDGSEEKPAFGYNGTRPFAWLRQTHGTWQIDANRYLGVARSEDFFEPRTWFYFNPNIVALINDIAARIENGAISTADGLQSAFRDASQKLQQQVDQLLKNRPLNGPQIKYFSALMVTRRFMDRYFAGFDSLDNLYLWSVRLANEETARSSNKKSRAAAASDFLERMKDVSFEMQERASRNQASVLSYLASQYYLADAESLVAAREPPLCPEPVIHPPVRAAHATATVLYQAYRDRLTEPPTTQAGAVQARWPYILACYRWSERILTTEKTRLGGRLMARGVAEHYVERSRELEGLTQAEISAGRVFGAAIDIAKFYVADSEVSLMETKNEQEKAKSAAAEMRLDAATRVFHRLWDDLQGGKGSTEEVHEWSERLLQATLALARSKPNRIAAVKEHARRMGQMQEIIKQKVAAGRMPIYETWAMDYYVEQAASLLSDGRDR
jgi:hypothetical protein